MDKVFEQMDLRKLVKETSLRKRLCSIMFTSQ